MLRLLNLAILIDWSRFKPGTSFFIPCLDRKAVADYVVKEATRLRFQVTCKQVVEKGRYGLRVWRLA
jgi:hypothetical protein